VKLNFNCDDDVFVIVGVHNLDIGHRWEFGFRPGTLFLYPLYWELDGFQKAVLTRERKWGFHWKPNPVNSWLVVHNPVQCCANRRPSDICRGSARNTVAWIHQRFKTPWNILNVHRNIAGTLSRIQQYCTVSRRCKLTSFWTVKIYIYIYIKVKWSRYGPGVAQSVGRGIALLFRDHGNRRGWVVSSTPRPHFAHRKDPVPILQEAGWAPGSVW